MPSNEQRIVFVPPRSRRLYALTMGEAVERLSEPGLAIDPRLNKSGAVRNSCGWLALPGGRGRSVVAARTAAFGQIERYEIASPLGMAVTCCAVYENWLIVATAGECRGFDERPPGLFTFDLASKHPKWSEAPIQPDLLEGRERFDDLALSGTELIVLDNVVTTKQLFRFDLTSLPHPRLVAHDTFFMGVYAEAHRVVVGRQWAAAYCTTTSDLPGPRGVTTSRHLRIMTQPEWRVLGTVSDPSLDARSNPRCEGDVEAAAWLRIEALGAYLLVETRAGLYVLDAQTLIAESKEIYDMYAGKRVWQFGFPSSRYWCIDPALRGRLIALKEAGVAVLMGQPPTVVSERDLRAVDDQ